MKEWSPSQSEELYGINNWSESYFRINSEGEVCVTPLGGTGPQLSLYNLTQELLDRGIRVPIVIRFPEIIQSRIEFINSCFQKAFQECDYNGRYNPVYPIKVNQQRQVVDDILNFGSNVKMGLECGSKPELLIVLGAAPSRDSIIICNGFKDEEYIETALLSRKLGYRTIIVIDRIEELPMVIEASEALSIKPLIGFRVKLNTQGAGKWVESSGVKSKFGLTAMEVNYGMELLKEKGMLKSLQLLHFHIGSQIPDISCIKGSLQEAARYYTELYQMGANLQYMDVGGGLGVDYDGTGATDSSMNYSEQEYANDVVSTMQWICDEKRVPHPHIITESGRFLTAHHSLLIFNVLGVNKISDLKKEVPIESNSHQLLKDLSYLINNLSLETLNESYNDLATHKVEMLNLFKYGVLTLKERAQAESLYWTLAENIFELSKEDSEYEDIYLHFRSELTDTYFCNFSVFQSVPDSWALDQAFPIMPIHRLQEEPDCRANLVDLTCDSDGRIDQFIDRETTKNKPFLEVHQFNESEPYFLGAFLTGAYQEILGDLHNLFGDTDAVHITLLKDGSYTIDHYVPGDTVTEVLSYVQYQKGPLIDNIRRKTEHSILEKKMSKGEAKLLIRHYEDGLNGYTYLEDPE